MSRLFALCLMLMLANQRLHAAPSIAVPPSGKSYHGFYYDGPATNEHDVTAADVDRFEKAVGAKTVWVFFSHNWFESRRFPSSTCQWIHGLGKVPYIRLMLRSDLEQNRTEKTFTLSNILAGKFDPELKAWARDAKSVRGPDSD